MGGKINMKNKTTLGLFALGIVAILGISMVAAYQGNPNIQGPNYSEERHEAMQDAFETGDYDSWVSLMTENDRHPKIVDAITADNFDEFIEARNAALEGDPTALKELKESLGLGLGQMKHGNGVGRGRGLEMKGKGIRQGNCPLAE